MSTHHGRDVSGPQAEGLPLDVLQERGAVLGQAVDEGARQGGGHLQELVCVEERGHCGVEAGGGGAAEQNMSHHGGLQDLLHLLRLTERPPWTSSSPPLQTAACTPRPSSLDFLPSWWRREQRWGPRTAGPKGR